MNKATLYILILSILVLHFSCISNHLLSDKTINSKIFIEEGNHIVGFKFDKNIKNISWRLLIKNNKVNIFEGDNQNDMVPVTYYIFTFTHNQDTMIINTNYLSFSENYYFDKIKFKKGKHKIIFNKEKNKEKAKNIIEDEKLLNKKVIYKPYNDFKGKTVLLKDLEFEYYNLKQKDSTLIKDK